MCAVCVKKDVFEHVLICAYVKCNGLPISILWIFTFLGGGGAMPERPCSHRKSWQNFLRIMAELQQIRADYGRSRWITADHCRLRQIMADYGRLRQITADYSRSGRITADHGRLRRIMVNHGRKRRITAD